MRKKSGLVPFPSSTSLAQTSRGKLGFYAASGEKMPPGPHLSRP